jgi:hypothetical protein
MSTPDHTELAELDAKLAETTAAWDATDEVDTNLGVEVQQLGERLSALLNGLTLNPEVSNTLREEAEATQMRLGTAVDHYEVLDEHDTTSALDIYELLPGALELVERALGGAPELPLTFPAWPDVAEPYADGSDPIERFVVTLVVGSDPSTTRGHVTDPKRAALDALNLTRDEESRSTVWHVYDRATGTLHRFDQSEFDTEFDPMGDTTVSITREQIRTAYDHEPPEDMGDGPFHLYPEIDGTPDGTPADSRELCTVVRAADVAYCLTCEAHGYLDGYEATHAGIERWHREL